jgi:hypothetical protein
MSQRVSRHLLRWRHLRPGLLSNMTRFVAEQRNIYSFVGGPGQARVQSRRRDRIWWMLRVRCALQIAHRNGDLKIAAST